MVRQWIHKPRLPKQLELFCVPSYSSITCSILYLHYQSIHQSLLPTNQLTSTSSILPTKQNHNHNHSRHHVPRRRHRFSHCPLYQHPLLLYCTSIFLTNHTLDTIPNTSKRPQLTPPPTDPPPIREQQQRQRHRRRRRQGHREGGRNGTEGQGGHRPRHRTGTGQSQRGLWNRFRQGELACWSGAGQGGGAGGQGEGCF